MYGWTFAAIADMTPYSQMAALGMLDNVSDSGKTLSFNTQREYDDYLANQARK